MLYFDTAYLAKCYLNEPGAQQVRQLAASAPGLVSSEWARIEFFAVIQRNLREGKLTQTQMQQIISYFRQDEANGVLNWLSLSPLLLEQTCQRIQTMPTTLYLRAADALHLTCAAEHGFLEIYSSDRHLLAAAPHFQLTGTNVI